MQSADRENLSSAYVKLFAAQLAIGAAAIFARWALTGTGPFMASCLRLWIATIVVQSYRGIMAARTATDSTESKVRLTARHEILLALAGLCLALHFVGWIASLQYTSVAISTLLVCTSPIWTALWDLLTGREKPKPLFLASFALGATGVALIAFAKSTGAPAASAATGGQDLTLFGDGLAAAGAVAIAAYLIAVRRVSKIYPTNLIVSRTYPWAAVVLLAMVPASGEHLPTGTMSWVGVLCMALVSQVLGHTAINQSLKWLSPSTVAMATLLEPVLAAILAAALFQEGLTLQTIGGGLLVLVALYGVMRSG